MGLHFSWAGPGAVIVAGLSVAVTLTAQPLRILHSLDASRTKVLVGNRTPRALLQDDEGPLNPFERIGGLTLVFKPSPGQASELLDLLQQQRDPSSPNYLNWLTPEQYASRFGINQNDLEKISAWLQTEGFGIDYVARGRTWMMFHGTAGQVLQAFHTEVHRYRVARERHYANATDTSIPIAHDPVLLAVPGLDDFRTESKSLNAMPVADFTSSGGTHALVPGDLATIYHVTPLYQGGITGLGQKIAVVGQTDVHLSDIEHFRAQYGLPFNDPQLVLVAGSPDPGVSPNDLIESSLDLEYAGGIAPEATILFVYSTDVWTSATQARPIVI